MIIDFKKIKSETIKQMRGGEKEVIANMYTDENNRIMYGKLEPGASIGRHTHDSGSEILYVLSGNGKMLYDDTVEKLEPGLCHYCPKGHSHSLVNDSDDDLLFFAVIPQQ